VIPEAGPEESLALVASCGYLEFCHAEPECRSGVHGSVGRHRGEDAGRDGVSGPSRVDGLGLSMAGDFERSHSR